MHVNKLIKYIPIPRWVTHFILAQGICEPQNPLAVICSANTWQQPDKRRIHSSNTFLPKCTKLGVALATPAAWTTPACWTTTKCVCVSQPTKPCVENIKCNILYQHICMRKLPPPFGTWIGLKDPELVSTVRSNSKGPWLLYMSTSLCAIRLFLRITSSSVYPCQFVFGQITYHFVCSSIHVATTLKQHKQQVVHVICCCGSKYSIEYCGMLIH